MRGILTCGRIGSILLVMLAFAGCGGSAKPSKLVSATGKVTLDGTPMTSGTVSFQPDDSKGNTSKFAPSGMIDSSGNYKLTTDGKDGAPLGWYKVSISQGMGMGTDAAGVTDPSKAIAPKAPLNAKYQTPATSGISIEVVESPAAGAYDLKVTK